MLHALAAIGRRTGRVSTVLLSLVSAPVAMDGATLALDTGARTATVATEPVEFTPKEFDLVALLYRERGRVVTRERLMDEVWDENWFGSTTTLDVTVARVRHKLDAVGSVTRIVTVRCVGSRLEDEDGAAAS